VPGALKPDEPFFVSPFLDLQGEYQFQLRRMEEEIYIRVVLRCRLLRGVRLLRGICFAGSSFV
jgi:DUF1365 family protein